MKILLLKPINDAYYVVQPPIGLGYLAAVALAAGHQVRILDAGREKLSWESFAAVVREEKYDLIGIQVFSHELPAARRHAEIIKRESPGSLVAVGGPQISGDPEGTAGYLEEMDFGFVGEAETGLERFLRLEREDYSDPARLREVPNLVWREGPRTTVNPRGPVLEPDRIAFPAWQLIDPRTYPAAAHGVFYRSLPVAPIITSRGCPFPCAFCAARAVTGPKLRYRSVENVIREIILLSEQYGVREFHVEDDNFTGRRDYVIAFCREIIKHCPGLAFALPNGVRLDSLDREVLVLMEQAGFYGLAVGIESGSERVLSLMRKGLAREMIGEKIALIKASTKIRVAGFFLIGYPGETEAEIRETISFARRLPLDLASFLNTMPLPGSPLWEDYGRRGYREINWEDFIPSRVVAGVSELPPAKLKQLQRKATLEFYLRPKIIAGLIKEMKKFSQLRIIGRRLMETLVSAG